jgi:hypothetical protein
VDRPDSQPWPPLAGIRQPQHLGGDGCAERRHRDRDYRWRIWTTTTVTGCIPRPEPAFKFAWSHILRAAIDLSGSRLAGARDVHGTRRNVVTDPAGPLDVSADPKRDPDVQAETDADADTNSDTDANAAAAAVALPNVH